MHLRIRVAAFALLIALVGAFVVAPLGASAKPASAAALTVPVTSTPTASSTGALTDATFTLERFTTQNGQLAAVGTLAGAVTDSAGAVVGTISQQVTLPVAANGTCQVLHLVLGPLDLNLLGLVVHLDQVVLDITAQSGPGNLLGNLLCAVTHLLDSNATAGALANLLNLVLTLLA